MLSLQRSWPAGIATEEAPPANVTRVIVPLSALAPYSCRLAVTASNVSGLSLKTLENRTRILSPHRSGLIRRGGAPGIGVRKRKREVGLDRRGGEPRRCWRQRLVLGHGRHVDEIRRRRGGPAGCPLLV